MKIFENTVNKNVTQDNIDLTICKSGYTKIIRPNTGYTNAIKYRMLENIGIDKGAALEYVLDHVIPLSLGGHPTNEDNLVIRGIEEGKKKNKLELKLKCLVCSKVISLIDAQKAIYGDWKQAYIAYFDLDY